MITFIIIFCFLSSFLLPFLCVCFFYASYHALSILLHSPYNQLADVLSGDFLGVLAPGPGTVLARFSLCIFQESGA